MFGWEEVKFISVYIAIPATIPANFKFRRVYEQDKRGTCYEKLSIQEMKDK